MGQESDAGGEVRLSALQPRGLTDYMHHLSVGIEVAVAILGWATLVIAIGAATDVIGMDWDGWTAAAVGFISAYLALMSTGALVLQHRLTSAPQPASDVDHLVVGDVVLGWSLWDLFGATGGALALASWLMWWIPDRPWTLVWLYTFSTIGLLTLAKATRKQQRNLAPVAKQLTTQGPAT